MANQGIRGIRQSIPSGYMIGRQSPGSSKGAPGLIPLPPLNQQPVIAGAGGKATQGGGSTNAGTIAGSTITVTGGTGISVTGAPAYTVALQVPVTVADGGTNATSASGTALDNITGFSSTGILERTGAGAYTFIANGQLPATATNNNAIAGNVGEYVSSIILAAGEVNINAVANITSISLTAGDWDVWGEPWFDNQTGSATVSGTVKFGVTPTSAVIPPTPGDNLSKMTIDATFLITSSNIAVGIIPCRASLASTTTYFLVGQATVSAGTAFAYGKLCARRVR